MSIPPNLTSPANNTKNPVVKPSKPTLSVNPATERVQKLAPLSIRTPVCSSSPSTGSVSTTFSTPSTLSTNSFTTATPNALSTKSSIASPFFTPSKPSSLSTGLSICTEEAINTDERNDEYNTLTPKAETSITVSEQEQTPPPVLKMKLPIQKPKFSMALPGAELTTSKKPMLSGLTTPPDSPAGFKVVDLEDDDAITTFTFSLPPAETIDTQTNPLLTPAAHPTPKGQAVLDQILSPDANLTRLGKTRGVYKVSQEDQTIAYVKPFDEVRGCELCPDTAAVKDKEGILPEMASYNELIAKRLAPSSFPQAIALNRITSPAFHFLGKKDHQPVNKMCLVIEAMNAKSPNEIEDPALQKAAIARISPNSAAKMALLDLRLVNPDRNLGNVLISKDSPETAIPIDHACILPQGFESDCTFTWMKWDQSKLPFDQDTLAEISSLDVAADQNTIREICPEYPQANLDVMDISYFLLKEARHYLTPFQIGLFYEGHPSMPCSLLYQMHQAASKMIDKMRPLSDGTKPTINQLMKPWIKEAIKHLVKNPEIMSNLETWQNAKADLLTTVSNSKKGILEASVDKGMTKLA